MKHNKRFFALMLAGALLLACAGCGKAVPSNDPPTGSFNYLPFPGSTFPEETPPTSYPADSAPEYAAQIQSDRFLAVEKNMTMQQVMDTLGKTSYVIGQLPSAMYYFVDGKPLKIDFVNLTDVYPYSGQEMKQYWDTFGAVTFKTINITDLTRLTKGMKPADIVQELGNTIDVGSGRYILKYSVWDGLSLSEFTFNSGGEGLPYSGQEIYDLVSNEESEVFW